MGIARESIPLTGRGFQSCNAVRRRARAAFSNRLRWARGKDHGRPAAEPYVPPWSGNPAGESSLARLTRRDANFGTRRPAIRAPNSKLPCAKETNGAEAGRPVQVASWLFWNRLTSDVWSNLPKCVPAFPNEGRSDTEKRRHNGVRLALVIDSFLGHPLANRLRPDWLFFGGEHSLPKRGLLTGTGLSGIRRL